METMNLTDSEWSLIVQALREKADSDRAWLNELHPDGRLHFTFKDQAKRGDLLADKIADQVGV